MTIKSADNLTFNDWLVAFSEILAGAVLERLAKLSMADDWVVWLSNSDAWVIFVIFWLCPVLTSVSSELICSSEQVAWGEIVDLFCSHPVILFCLPTIWKPNHLILSNSFAQNIIGEELRYLKHQANRCCVTSMAIILDNLSAGSRQVQALWKK